MLKEGIHGFCMALADSVPGVSGGTVAFIMGFYDRFIGSVHDLVFGRLDEKKSALMYLAELGVGWAAGMLLAVAVLSALFNKLWAYGCQILVVDDGSGQEYQKIFDQVGDLRRCRW